MSLTVANDKLKDNVKLDDNFKVTQSDDVKDSYFISYEKENGTLKFEYSTLAVAVKSNTEQKVYVMNGDESFDIGIGTMNGSSLSINGNNHNIIGSGDLAGITLGKDQTLSLNGLGYSGFDTAVENNGGTLNITNVTFENNTTDILNNGTLNAYGNNSVSQIIGNNGTTNINSYTDTDGKVINSTLTVQDNLTQNIINIAKDNTLSNNGSVTANNINNAGTLTNNKDLLVQAGTNTGIINGNGDMQISGKFTNTGSITQNILNVTENAEFTTTLDNIITTDKKITNEGTLIATGGTNTSIIEGNGKTEIKGEVVNNGKINQTSVNVLQGGKLTTDLDNIVTDDIQISGELNLLGNKIEKNINGTSTGVVNVNTSMTVNSTISGAGVALNGGTMDFGSKADLSNISNFIVNGGNMTLVNNAIGIMDLGQKLTLNKDLNLSVDVDLLNVSMDRLTAKTLEGTGYVNVQTMKMLSDAKDKTTRVLFADEVLKDNVKTDIKTVSYSPIWKYGVEYDKDSGEFIFTKGGNGGSNNNNGGNNSNGGNNNNVSAFNPSVLASPVASQVSGQVTMTHTFNEAFQHADWFSKLPASERFAKLNNNQYAISTNYNGNLGHIDTNYANQGFWTRPYAAFESINLKNGPKVNSIAYGTIVGGDSAFRKLGHGWSNVGSAYIGYHGSQFNYSGNAVSATTNGGVLGITETFYKGNFYTAITATAGANFAEMHDMYGKQDLPMLMAGVASKSGYNMEFNDGKFIIQPNLLMSYSYVGAFNSKNAAGVHIDNDPLHTIQLNPSLRFIGNTKTGWQPYATVGMVWNIMNKTNASANGIELPGMSTKPYVEYGVGLQKLWSDKYSAYGQATLRNGGRSGIALTAGFKWNLGKVDDTKVQDDSKDRTVLKQITPEQKRAMEKKNTTMSSMNAVLKQL